MFNEHLVATVAVIMVFLIPIVLLIQFGATWRARIIAARDEAYRELAQKSADAQKRAGEEIAEPRKQIVAEFELAAFPDRTARLVGGG